MDELPPPIAQSIKSLEEANSVLSELEIHLQDQADRLLKKVCIFTFNFTPDLNSL